MANQGQSTASIFHVNLPTGNIALICVVLLATIILAAPTAQTQTFRVIHAFTGGVDGAIPLAGLIADRAGTLYGTASGGGQTGGSCGSYGCGAAFRLKSSGTDWALTPLYVFQGGTDGANPEARMVFAANGLLYGTTAYGGGNRCNNTSCGTAFSLSPPATACKIALCGWNETVIYRFLGSPYAGVPTGGPLVFDKAVNLYGVAGWGPDEHGVVYELMSAGGTWSEIDLAGSDNSTSGVVFDNAGNLYGSNTGEGYGGVYQLLHTGSGWSLNQLYSIINVPEDGFDTYGGVILDNAGNIYASTQGAGPGDGGTVFELSAGTWNFGVLYGFNGGTGPEESLTMDSAGNLYGTTLGGGAYSKGTVFRLSPSANGWIYTDLYDFTGGSDGANPVSNVVIDTQGNLYGTASHGGSGSCSQGCGVVWEIMP
jgi:uncharacterized repeat protein (TIGR03803 family)